MNIPAVDVVIEMPRGEVHSMSAIQPEMRRPMVLDMPTKEIKNDALDGDNPF